MELKPMGSLETRNVNIDNMVGESTTRCSPELHQQRQYDPYDTLSELINFNADSHASRICTTKETLIEKCKKFCYTKHRSAFTST